MARGKAAKKGNGTPGRAARRAVASKQKAEEDNVFLQRSRELRQEGNRHFGYGRFEHAKTSFEKALQLCEGHPKEAADLHSGLGSIHLLQRNFGDAVRECSLALEINPYAIKARQRRSKAYEMTGNLLGALADIRFLMRFNLPDRKAIAATEGKIVDKLRSVSAAQKAAVEEKRAQAEGADGAEPLVVKLERKGEIRLAQVPPAVNYAQLKAAALAAFSDLAHFNVTARDDEGDELAVTSAAEIALALRCNKTPKFLIGEVEEAKEVSLGASELEATTLAEDPVIDAVLNMPPPKPEGEDQGAAAAAAEKKKPEEEVYELDDWMIDFAELFKEHLGVDIDTPLDLSKEAWEKCAEALDAAVHNEKSEKLLRQAANKFEEVILTALVNLGNVYMCIARKYIDAKKEGEQSLEEVAKADAELDLAEGVYRSALERKADFADAILSLGQLEFEKGKISMSFGVPEGHKYHESTAETHFLSSIAFFKQTLDLLPAEEPEPEKPAEAEGKQQQQQEQEQEEEEGAKGEAAAAAGAGAGEVSHDANLQAQAKVMWGNALYELSQCFANADKEWNPTLVKAVEKFKEAKCRAEEVGNALEMHCQAKAIDKERFMRDFGGHEKEQEAGKAEGK